MKNKVIYILPPETIFTEKLVILPGGDRKLKEHSNEGEQFAYPINSSMLLFMDPKAISTNCTIKPEGDNYKASLFLELVNENGNSTSYTLEKILKLKMLLKTDLFH